MALFTMPASIGTPSSMPSRFISAWTRSEAKIPHQVVLQGEVEARGAGIALAARTTAKLVVDAT